MKEKCWDCGRWFHPDLMTRREMIVSVSTDEHGRETNHTGVVDLCPRCASDAIGRAWVGRWVVALIWAVGLLGMLAYWLARGR